MKPLSIECPNLTCIINQSWPGWATQTVKIKFKLVKNHNLIFSSKINKLELGKLEFKYVQIDERLIYSSNLNIREQRKTAKQIAFNTMHEAQKRSFVKQIFQGSHDLE